MAKLVENYLKTKANVTTQNGVAEFLGTDGKLTDVKLASSTEIPYELAVVAVGITPNVQLAKEAGRAVGALGGIAVDPYMQTSDPDIYAAADCCEIKKLITGENVLAPYGDLANLEGRVAGENAVPGNVARFPGTIQTRVCKLLDAQVIGPGDASKQLATWATALKGGLTVDDMVNADLPYAPPSIGPESPGALRTTAAQRRCGCTEGSVLSFRSDGVRPLNVRTAARRRAGGNCPCP